MEIIGFDNQGIEIELAARDSDTVCVMYPGRGYYLNSPIFLYTMLLLDTLRIGYVGVDLRYGDKKELRGLYGDRIDGYLKQDALAIAAGIAPLLGGYRRRIIIGKSLGTRLMKHQLQNGLIGEDADLIWLTPAGNLMEFYADLRTLKNRSLLVFGNKDDNYASGYAGKIAGTERIGVLEIDGAGHSFEDEGSVARSIDNLKTVVDRIGKFITDPVGR
jgi:hypothetical protein